VKHVQRYAFKPAIIKTKDEIESVVLKGVGSDFDWENVRDFLVEGEIFSAADSTSPYPVIFSQETARRLKLNVGDKVQMYFASRYTSGNMQMNIRVSVVKGIYKTGLADFDKLYALCPLQMLQRLNQWEPVQVSGAEIFVNDVDDMDAVGQLINEEHVDQTLTARTLHDLYPNLFDWLNLQKTNETIILVLMTLVALVNLMTMLLILILERSNFIGIMKALGATNGLVRRVFIVQAAYVIGWGLVIGNVLGLGICAVQYFTHAITLPEDSYFVNYAPVYFDWPFFIGMNSAVFVISILVMIIPSWLVARVDPVKVLRFN
jgi:lipoprotein-releasing system permease protein